MPVDGIDALPTEFNADPGWNNFSLTAERSACQWLDSRCRPVSRLQLRLRPIFESGVSLNVVCLHTFMKYELPVGRTVFDPSESDLERFWARVRKDTPSGCWEWTGTTAKSGHGFMQKGGAAFQRSFPVQRISYLIHFNEDPGQRRVERSCGNIQCVNPEHLYLGAVKPTKNKPTTLTDDQRWANRQTIQKTKKSRDKRRRSTSAYKTHANEGAKAWRKKPQSKKRLQKYELCRKYGLTPEDFEALWKAQGGLCAICKLPFDQSSMGGKACIDHDHEREETSGDIKVRGLLHSSCNLALGLLNDDQERFRNAIAYLDAAKAA